MKIERREAGMVLANTYLVWCEETREGMLVDPGAGAKAAIDRADALGVRIALIANTHTHPDHASANSLAHRRTAAPLAAHSAAARQRNLMRKLESGFGLFYRPGGFHRLLADGDTIKIGRLSFTVLHTPGHTDDGICIVGEGIALTGDTLFADSIGRSDLPGGSTQKLVASLLRLLALPDETIIYPGHGPESTIGRERAHNPFCAQLLAAAKPPNT